MGEIVMAWGMTSK